MSVNLSEEKYLITKRGAYYKPNAQGYTNLKHLAGRYTLEQAIRYSHPNGKDGPRDGISFVPEETAPLSLDSDINYALESYRNYIIYGKAG